MSLWLNSPVLINMKVVLLRTVRSWCTDDYLTGLPPARRASSLVAVSDSEIAIVAFTPKPKGNTISTGEEKCDSERCVRN